jgi:SAM-dependent methyltransferase
MAPRIQARLVCPDSKLALTMGASDAPDLQGFAPTTVLHGQARCSLVGERVAIRAGRDVYYPITEDDIPILMAPEAYHRSCPPSIDVAQQPFAEAYAEMAHYDEVARCGSTNISDSDAARFLNTALGAKGAHLEDLRWLDATFDASSQRDAYKHLAPQVRAGGVVAQLGGSGLHSVKFLLAGAIEAWLVSPMIEELRFAVNLAHHFGVGDRFHPVCAIGERLPFAEGQFDALFYGGSLHHTVVTEAIFEAHRVLRGGGRLAAVEPWRAPLYGVGTKIFGKRERNVHCIPLDETRMARSKAQFGLALMRHGALARYGMLALWKLGWKPTIERTLTIAERVDAALPSGIQKRLSSSVAVCLEKT